MRITHYGLPFDKEDMELLAKAVCGRSLIIDSGMTPEELGKDLEGATSLMSVDMKGNSLAEIAAALPCQSRVTPDLIIISVIIPNRATPDVKEFSELIEYVNQFGRSVEIKWLFSNDSGRTEAIMEVNILYISK